MRRKEIVLIFLLLTAIAPYFVLCFYALPYADDFYYARISAGHMSWAARILYQYMGWSGRYSAHVLLCHHPLAGGGLIAYQAADCVALSVFSAAAFLFIRGLVSRFRAAAIVTCTVLLFYLCYMPLLSDGVYWYTGICNYELSSAFFILHLALCMRWYGSSGALRAVYIWAAAAALIISIGCNEVAAALTPAYYLLAVIVLYRNRTDSAVLRVALVFLCLSLASSAVLAFAPGNVVRSHQYHDHFHLLHSLFFASLQTARFMVIWLGTISALLLSILVLSVAGKLPDARLFRFDHRLIMLLLLFTVFMSAFLPYFTTGILGQHRTIDYAFFYFILLWLWWLISLSRRYSLYKLPAMELAGSHSHFLIIVCIAVMVCTADGGRILRDLREGTFSTYGKEFVQRQNDLLRYPDMQVPPLNTVPETFKIVDARTDTTYWINTCIREYYSMER